MEAELHAAASQMTGGLTDFGNQDYVPGLRALLASYEQFRRWTSWSAARQR